ncbi:MAG TPA: SH3 domain-containing protein, partial [Candidatus Blautia faecavium]|nr:SH3 domain-containing protein [Candidatus Blautia faecavium]
KRVSADKIKIAILRITERGNVIDPTFENNYKGFRSSGVKVGVYKYSYALNTSQAQKEAEKVLEVLKGRKLDFPVFYDVEWSEQRQLPKEEITRIIKAFREKIVKAGYLFGIYCNTDWYYHVLDTKNLPYDYWLAAYPYNDRGVIVESLRPSVGIGWQYSAKGKVAGINGYVDLDVFYKDFSDKEEIKPENEYKIWVGECTGNGVNVRRGPGLEYLPIEGYPYLNKGNLVDVIGERRAADKVLWYRILIADKYKGYIRHDYLKRV